MTTVPDAAPPHEPKPARAAPSSRTKTLALAAGGVGVGVALLVAALLTNNGTLALIEAIVGVLIITSLVTGFALRQYSRSATFDRISQERRSANHRNQ